MGLIVVVDDDDAGRELSAYILRSAGHDVIERADSSDLLEVIRAQKPALVLLDLSLPGENGISACRRIKSDAACAGTRVVMLTAHDSFEAVRQTIAAGADRHLVKPIERDQLLACVSEVGRPRKTWLQRTRGKLGL